jgi:hypothetical protein
VRSAGVTAAPLRVGVLVEALHLARWQRCVLEQLAAGGDTELVVVVEDASPPRGRPPVLGRRFLWRLYNNVWVRRRSASIARVDCADLLGALPLTTVTPVREGRYVQRFPPPAIEELRGHRLDVLLRFGFGILGGDVLDVARHGVWSFHHDDERVIRGGPPSFWEVAGGLPTTGVLFQRLTSRLDAGVPLARATFRTVGHSYPRNRDRAAFGGAVLAARVARAVRHGWLDAHGPASVTDAPVRRDPSNRQMLAFVGRQALRIPAIQSRSILRGPRWTVGVAAGGPALAVPAPIEWIPERRAGDLADPFPARRDGTTALLVEELDSRSATGVISSLRRDGDRWVTTSAVIAPGVHASYPYLVEHDGELYCVPETARARRVEAWRCLEFPDRWRRHATLLDGVPLLDPTIVEWEGRWWLFGTRRDRDPDAALWLWHAHSPLGPWVTHPANPVKIDATCSRPAGTPFVVSGALYRPAQDCSRGYGRAVVLNRVTRLDDTTFAEELVGPVTVSSPRHTTGSHTFAQRDGLIAVDARRQVVDLRRSRRELLARLRR